jgi:hypothetical protein
MMTAQLVLQFPLGEDVDNYNKLIRFEGVLIASLGLGAKVDGHDFGAGEMNIFILTQDPVASFAFVQQTDRSLWPSQEVRAAFRSVEENDYVCLWPPELDHFQVA